MRAAPHPRHLTWTFVLPPGTNGSGILAFPEQRLTPVPTPPALSPLPATHVMWLRPVACVAEPTRVGALHTASTSHSTQSYARMLSCHSYRVSARTKAIAPRAAPNCQRTFILKGHSASPSRWPACASPHPGAPSAAAPPPPRRQSCRPGAPPPRSARGPTRSHRPAPTPYPAADAR